MQSTIVIFAVCSAVVFLIYRIKKQFSQKHDDCSGCAMNKSTQNQTK
jgi:hypothetical protein